MNNLSLLSETLVPFKTRAVKTETLWFNELAPYSLDLIKDEASFMIDNEQSLSVYDTSTQLLSNEKIFFAERYGGDAISRNGGGVRCGYDGRWQVKGIGTNILVGRESKRMDGELSLVGAVLEVLWEKIMDEILPYGTVKNYAILLSNINKKVTTDNNGIVHNRRALLIREPVIRPAHFCRAPYYQPISAMNSQLADHLRVEKLIPLLPSLLPRPMELSQKEWESTSKEIQSRYGLCELTKRLAIQIGFCRSRHLVMMTSASNCDLTGRLLDFHGVRNVFPAGRQNISKDYMHHRKLLEDAPLLLKGVLDMSFYLGKYKFGSNFYSDLQQDIESIFHSHYKYTCLIENLNIIGFDKKFLSTIEPTYEFMVMGEYLQKVLDLSAGVFTQAAGLYLDDLHPAIPLINKVIDGVISKKSITNGNSAHENFILSLQQLYNKYFSDYTLKNKTISELSKEVRNIVSRRLGKRDLMNRENIVYEINNLNGNVNEISYQLRTYQDKFERFALRILK